VARGHRHPGQFPPLRSVQGRDDTDPSIELEAQPHAEMCEDRAGQHPDAIPNNVVDVGDAVRQKVLPCLDRAGKSQTGEEREDVGLNGRPLDRVEGDEQQETKRHKEQNINDNWYDN